METGINRVSILSILFTCLGALMILTAGCSSSDDDDDNDTGGDKVPALSPTLSETFHIAATDVAAGETALRSELERRGLTPPEAAAFLRAWSSDLFGVDTSDPAAPANTAVVVGGGRPTKSDLLLVWLERETVDAILPLTFSPAPTRLERAHLLVIDLTAL